MSRSVLTIAATLLALSPAPAAWASEPACPNSANASAQVDAKLKAALDGVIRAQKIPGASVAVAYSDGRLAVAASGLSDIEAAKPMTVAAVMPAASIGKTYVSAWALNLSRSGALDLDAPISRWLGDETWFSKLPNGPDITVRMLLNHSSGLIDHAWSEDWLKNYFGKTRNDPDHYFPPAEMVGYVLDRPALFPAGNGYNYSDTNYVLAGMILEKVSHKTYFEGIRETFLEPLGLRGTYANARKAPGLVNGYLREKNELGIPERSFVDGAMFVNPAVEFTGGGFMSTSADLACWALALYEGRAMEGPYLDELLRPNPAPVDKGVYYGLGVNIAITPAGRSWGHSGTMPYYGSVMAYFPDRKLAIAIMANRTRFDRIAAAGAILAALDGAGAGKSEISLSP